MSGSRSPCPSRTPTCSQDSRQGHGAGAELPGTCRPACQALCIARSSAQRNPAGRGSKLRGVLALQAAECCSNQAPAHPLTVRLRDRLP